MVDTYGMSGLPIGMFCTSGTNGIAPVTKSLLDMTATDLSYWMRKLVLEVHKKMAVCIPLSQCSH